jgi:peptidoglycan/LPS O-acetylase OafA/YrhL
VKTEVPAAQPLVRRFMPELDVLRGIAVLGVLFFHGFRVGYGELPFTGAHRVLLLATQPGALGVNLFFVLSGFLITGILLDSRNRPDYYRRFYTRRALRILPAYYSLLILLGLLGQASAAFLGLSFVYLSNVVTLAGLVLLFLVLGTSSRKGLVNGSTLQFFGYISYGLYLFHPMIFRIYDKVTRIFWPWLQPSVGHFGLIVLRFAVVSAAAIGLSFISRKYYEEWFLQLKERIAAQPAETAVKVAVTVPPAAVTAREASESFLR